MTTTFNGECQLTPSGKDANMGLFKWLKRRNNRNTMQTTYVSPRMYDELMKNTPPERNVHLAAAARRAESTVRRVPAQPSSPSRSIGRASNDSALWSPTYSAPDSSSSSGCSDSGSSSSSSDSGSSGSCDSGGF